MPRVLVLDDEQNVLDMIERALSDTYTVRTYTVPEQGVAALKEFRPDVVITDIKMDTLDGFAVLQKVQAYDPEVNVILITAYASVDTAVAALRGGAFDYLIKPFKIYDLRLVVQRALSEKKIGKGIRKDQFSYKEIVGKSPAIGEIKRLIERVAQTDSTVLIQGESGTGKELVARLLHAASLRVQEAFVSINCAALPDTLLESELFGHEKGSFTGALDTKIGLIEYARGGSVFLDEVGETSLNIQVKLLRALQEKEIKRVGGLTSIPVDVRFIAATSKNLEEEVQRGSFREDFFYRINVIVIPIPPLRERREDIALLAQHFVDCYNERMKTSFRLESGALPLFQEHTWPGNVRELENTVERILTLADTEVITPAIIQNCWGKKTDEKGANVTLSSALKQETESLEKDLIIRVLEETEGNKMQAAKKLNISRQSLQYKLKKYGLM